MAHFSSAQLARRTQAGLQRSIYKPQKAQFRIIATEQLLKIGRPYCPQAFGSPFFLRNCTLIYSAGFFVFSLLKAVQSRSCVYANLRNNYLAWSTIFAASGFLPASPASQSSYNIGPTRTASGEEADLYVAGCAQQLEPYRASSRICRWKLFPLRFS